MHPSEKRAQLFGEFDTVQLLDTFNVRGVEAWPLAVAVPVAAARAENAAVPVDRLETTGSRR